MSSVRLNKIIFFLYAALLFLAPLFFLPYSFELFEFNKIILVYAFTLLITSAWAGRMILEKRIIFKKTFLFWPLIIFFLSQLLSTVFSIDPHTSFYGYYSRFNGGLLSVICYLLLFWALVSNGKKDWVEKLITISLISALLVAFYGVLEKLGIDKNIWVQDVQNRVFSTLGQPNWLAAFLAVFLIIIPARASLFHYALFIVLYLCLLFTKSRSGFLGFGSGFLLFSFSSFLIFKKKRKELFRQAIFLPGLIIISLSLIFGTPFSSSISDWFQNKPPQEEKGLAFTSLDEPNITPSSQIRKIVWKGALALWKEQPLLGTGVETFAYAYYWVRPAEHNLTSEWDFLYNKAHNEYLNYAANSGSLGLLSYLILVFIYSFWVFKKLRHKNIKKKEKLFVLAFFSSWVSILVSNFFGFSVVATSLWFFLLPAFSFLLHSRGEKEAKIDCNLNLGQKILLLLLIFNSSLLTFHLYSYWQADYYLAAGIEAQNHGSYEQSANLLSRAIELRKNEPLYYDKLSLTLAYQGRIQEAIEASDRALGLNPYQLNYYRDRASLFYILSQRDIDYLKRSLEAMLAAINLAPTDAKLYYNAGLMFSSLGEKEKGREYLKKAVELKSNYDQARQFLENE
ncbi:MAG: O-antigen ligase family protein [Candidatus Shapirobacteria bacterium]